MQQIFWIDVQHGYVLRRAETYMRMGGKLVLLSETTVPLLSVSKGIWLPAVSEEKLAVPLEITKRSNPQKSVQKLGGYRVEGEILFLPAVVKRATITNFAANCNIPPEVFSVSWPLHTAIQDLLTNKRFTIMAVGDRESYSLWASEQKKYQARVQSKPKGP